MMGLDGIALGLGSPSAAQTLQPRQALAIKHARGGEGRLEGVFALL
jgi:hypothetical protein